MKDEVEKLTMWIVEEATSFALGGHGFATGKVRDKITTLLHKAQVEAVRAALESLLESADVCWVERGDNWRSHEQSVHANLIKDRLARLGEK